jgi:hypothetical protein
MGGSWEVLVFAALATVQRESPNGSRVLRQISDILMMQPASERRVRSKLTYVLLAV